MRRNIFTNWKLQPEAKLDMQPRSNSLPNSDASILKLLGLWCRIGSVFVRPPVLLFLMSPIPRGRS